jgi:hypothetical protein
MPTLVAPENPVRFIDLGSSVAMRSKPYDWNHISEKSFLERYRAEINPYLPDHVGTMAFEICAISRAYCTLGPYSISVGNKPSVRSL